MKIGNKNDLSKRRVLQYYSESQQIFRVTSSGEGKLPYPKMAFIFPTYRCNLNCKNCMYGEYIQKCKKNGYYNHLDKIRDINIQKVCKAYNVCNCSFVDYQRLLEKTMIEEDMFNNIEILAKDEGINRFL